MLGFFLFWGGYREGLRHSHEVGLVVVYITEQVLLLCGFALSQPAARSCGARLDDVSPGHVSFGSVRFVSGSSCVPGPIDRQKLFDWHALRAVRKIPDRGCV